MSQAGRRDRLGKGLGALLGDYFDPEVKESEIRKLSVKAIVPNPLQPRREFSEAELRELADSIRDNGLLQPVVVRPSSSGGPRYELVAGERRLRAVTLLGWSEVPVLVREASDETLLVLALVENLQREALNPMEEAEGFRLLGERFSMTQAEIARAVGKDRSTVANLLRLLKLPPSVRKLVEQGALTVGHARALLAIEDDVRVGELARKAVADGWSVREVERRVASAVQGTRSGRRRARPRDPVVRALEEALQEALSTRVTIRHGRAGRGVIEISFHDATDFERVFELVAGQDASAVVR